MRETESMSQYVIDYFAVIGKPSGPLVCTSFPLRLEEDGPSRSSEEVWGEAITDLILVSSGEL